MFALVFSFDSHADETIVVGSISCKEWVADRASESDYRKKYIDQNWLVGFLGGYAMSNGVDFLAEVKTQSVYTWMDKYCASHPQKKIEDGAIILVHELIQKMEK